MTTNKDSKVIVKKSGVDPIVAAVTGVVIAAGAVVAGALAMNDKKNRDAVNEKIDEVKDGAKKYVTEIKKTVNDGKNKLDKNIVKSKKEVKKSVDSILS